MIIIITMAGLGTRFRKVGWDCPKFMIEVKGRTLFDWSLDSLKGYDSHVSKYVFVVRREDNAESFILSKCREHGISCAEVLELDHMTDGQATTCMLALPHCSETEEILIYNIDTYVEPYALTYEAISGDGHIPCFKAEGDHWSFVRADVSGRAVEVREKERVSDNCSIGAYYFSSAKLFKKIYDEFYLNSTDKREKYIAPMYNYMIEKGFTVTMSLIEPGLVHDLGTPEELKAFADTE